jgi:UDP-4-amino-4,6-dideoxy-N-acetyl-beta-L-altrosamine transaminase
MSVPSMTSLPYGCHHLDDDDIAAVTSALRGELIAGGGPIGQAFESSFAVKVGARHAVVCSSGTAALHLAALALNLGEGDAVIVPSLTFLATANAARYVGAEVIFADVAADTGLLTAETLERAIAGAAGRRVKAVFPVHLNGQTVRMDEISTVANHHGLTIVEDACHALATTCNWNGTPSSVGDCSYSAISSFSLHPVKAIAMGEGGMLTTNDPALEERMRRLRSHGMVRDPSRFEQKQEGFSSTGKPNSWYYEMPEVGFNYRASEINSALGFSQLRKIDRFVARRKHIAGLYDKALPTLAPVLRPVERVPGCDPAWHLYAVLIDFASVGLEREEVMERLRQVGVGTQVHYLPVHRQPYYRRRYGELSLPGADAYYARCLSLPLFPDLTDDDVSYVVNCLRDILVG